MVYLHQNQIIMWLTCIQKVTGLSHSKSTIYIVCKFFHGFHQSFQMYAKLVGTSNYASTTSFLSIHLTSPVINLNKPQQLVQYC
jgi:hypothetical protein